MEVIRFIVFIVITAVLEIILLVRDRKDPPEVREDPLALRYKAKRVDEPSFGYIPGRSTYDDKSKRYVIDYRYEWEYQGKKHSMMFCDNPNSQYEHYLSTFPEEIDITINRNTGKYYISKTVRKAGFRSLMQLLIPALISWIITGWIFR